MLIDLIGNEEFEYRESKLEFYANTATAAIDATSEIVEHHGHPITPSETDRLFSNYVLFYIFILGHV